MKKFFIIFMALCLSIITKANDTYVVKATASVLDAPIAGSNSLGVLEQGQTISVLAIDGEWAIIQYNPSTVGFAPIQSLEKQQLTQQQQELVPSDDSEFASVPVSTPSDGSEFASAPVEEIDKSKGFKNSFTALGAGYNYYYSRCDGKNSDGLHGFRIPIACNIAFPSGFGMYAELSYACTFMKEKDNYKGTSHSFNLDLHASYAHAVADNVGLFLHVGPGFYGHWDVTKYKLNGSWKKQDELSGMRHLDLAIGIGAGIHINRAIIQFTYEFGMIKRIKDADKGTYNRELCVSVLCDLGK